LTRPDFYSRKYVNKSIQRCIDNRGVKETTPFHI
jgi:hypothetical protein